MPTYNKLVRDKIPEILEKKNLAYRLKHLDKSQFNTALHEKFQEEWREYQQTANNEEAVEELADLLEVIFAMAEIHGTTKEELLAVRQRKFLDRGGFDQKYYLIEVEDK
ncbi:Predicted house-cleaning noncanonical NTP pyrophosphatase, all-alpha NTP-PPase (MazG) superfamily [Gracilibacillus orientalis]|uniref:Predicted house-cleaning noncanonical NTP pyrophosphatase, all-alpha NTP-PPase (MazG) superfamily n=1 Tax=Gracilibacillus orientalis TaxID=334253 RepID=A0A1I4IZQ4_9BACI|nr:nucleoside triphosphate pyrophosphohydrolase [Gracilibacillus orientalis]SFL59760.1 Predicted house-cleaning noncanonical NTP pyrophosphatase, all-alpha NTP-PPase (MazG) superfamily [Gracilibacillus orientalis]